MEAEGISTMRIRKPVMTLCASALLGACAHAPASGGARPEPRVFVTGSHIAQRLDPRTGEPQMASPVRIYSREQLLGTGRQFDLGQALRTVDPGISP